MEQIMEAIQDVALAMREGISALREGNLIFERSLARLPIPEQDVFHLLDEIGIDSRLRMMAYLYLIKNLELGTSSHYWLSSGEAQGAIVHNDVWSLKFSNS